MPAASYDFVFIGLTITSSWGNGHATTYRALLRQLVARGHRVLFLERHAPSYANNRDICCATGVAAADRPYGRIELYETLDELRDRFTNEVRNADIVIVGSYVPDGVAVGEWVLKTAQRATAFYDIDTPVTIRKLQRNDYEYIAPWLIEAYDLYLSFTSGPTLRLLEKIYRAPAARALYCSVDAKEYFPEQTEKEYDLGYMGTFSDDRQGPLDRLMLEPARRWHNGRFCVAGTQYPPYIEWPKNVARIEHLPPAEHRKFYNSQRYALNITRAEMLRAGYSPSVRLFEAAACGTPIISDYWDGLGSLFTPGTDIFISHSPDETLKLLRETPEEVRLEAGVKARGRVLTEHTAEHRAAELEFHVTDVLKKLNMVKTPGIPDFSSPPFQN